MKSRRLISLLIAVLLLLTACSSNKEPVKLIEADSFFSDFAICQDKVLFLCRLRIDNLAGDAMTVRISGEFRDDVKNGLVTESALPGYAVDDETARAFADGIKQRSEEISLQPGQNELWIVFVGTHGSGNQKNDRNLPKITITPVNG